MHSETFHTTLNKGVFDVVVGSQEAFASGVKFDKQYWLGVSVDGGEEMTPRTALVSVPFAMHAQSANELSPNAKGAVTGINGKSGNLVLKGGIGTTIEEEGNAIVITANPIRTIVTPTAVTVSSITGTANQVLANGTSGVAQSNAVTLTLPQNIHSAATPTFGGLTLSGLSTAGVVHNSSAGLLSTSLITNADISSSAAIADTKLATISTAGKVANSATSGTSSNTANALVLRDGSGNFSAGDITADQIGTGGNTEFEFVTNGAVRARFKNSTGDTVTAGAFEPGLGNTYSLGTADRPWKELFISPGTITFTASTGAHLPGQHIPGVTSVASTGTLSFDDANNNFLFSAPVIHTYSEITASNNMNIPGTTAVTVITEPSGGIAPFNYTVSNGIDGQLIYIVNRASHTAQNSIANISSGKGISLLWVGGSNGTWIQITTGN